LIDNRAQQSPGLRRGQLRKVVSHSGSVAGNNRRFAVGPPAIIQADLEGVDLRIGVEAASAGTAEIGFVAQIKEQIFELDRPRISEGPFDTAADRPADM